MSLGARRLVIVLELRTDDVEATLRRVGPMLPTFPESIGAYVAIERDAAAVMAVFQRGVPTEGGDRQEEET
ncbi:MAG TPA: hypothetical protein VF506_17975 [Streptosporangiaceae bacterium]